MSNGTGYLEAAASGIAEIGDLASKIPEIVKQADAQADVRKEAIRTVDQMADALQLACDLVSKELSASITEFHRLRSEDDGILRGFFERLVLRFSDGNLRLLLHEGKVCGELHALGDRFSQPLSDVSRSALPWWESLRALFTRSTSMSMVVHGLLEGERDYLRDLSAFLDEVREKAEAATARPWGDLDGLRAAGDALAALMRERRRRLGEKVLAIRRAADAAIAKLH
jgi:hypothetical protein